jgi:hypothetical protein
MKMVRFVFGPPKNRSEGAKAVFLWPFVRGGHPHQPTDPTPTTFPPDLFGCRLSLIILPLNSLSSLFEYPPAPSLGLVCSSSCPEFSFAAKATGITNNFLRFDAHDHIFFYFTLYSVVSVGLNTRVTGLLREINEFSRRSRLNI